MSAHATRQRSGAEGCTRSRGPLTERLLVEVLEAAHSYQPGLLPRQPALVARQSDGLGRVVAMGRERARDLVERAACRAGFSRRHFDPQAAGERLAAVLTLAPELEPVYAALGDEASRHALLAILKLRVLGPFHSRLAITPEQFRAQQARVERDWRLQPATYEVSDPFFSPLSLFGIDEDGEAIRLHAHSVDLVSVFVREQYGYGDTVRAAPGDVVLDVGGCWGDTALYFARQVGPSGKVYTFEFDPESLTILRTNLALNPQLANRIEVVERALWDSSGTTLGFVAAGRCTTVRDEAPADTDFEVQTLTLDDFVREAGLARVDLIKMDVEGAERSVLRGARETLMAHAPKLAVAAYHEADDLVCLPQAIRGARADYRLYLASFSPVEEETVLFARATARSSST